MFKVTMRKMNLQAEGVYGVIKLVGNTEVQESGVIGGLSGTVFRMDGANAVYIGSFTMHLSLGISMDKKEDIDLLPGVAEAVNSFYTDMRNEVQRGGEG